MCKRHPREENKKKRAEVSESLLAIKVGTNIHFFSQKNIVYWQYQVLGKPQQTRHTKILPYWHSGNKCKYYNNLSRWIGSTQLRGFYFKYSDWSGKLPLRRWWLSDHLKEAKEQACRYLRDFFFPGKGNGKCKGPEVGTYLGCVVEQWEASMIRAERPQEESQEILSERKPAPQWCRFL